MTFYVIPVFKRTNEMKKQYLILLTIFLTFVLWGKGSEEMEGTPDSATRLITDMYGRQVEIPVSVEAVYSQSPVGTSFMYTLNSKKVAGLNWSPSEVERQFYTEEYCNLPVLSGWFGQGKTGNLEEIISVAPDFILYAGLSDEATGIKDKADRFQELLQIPVVAVNLTFNQLPAAYRFVGTLVGEGERGDSLAAYTEETLRIIAKGTASLTDDEVPRVYYAEGAEGLQTDPKGSVHSELIGFVGAINAAEVNVKEGYGRSQISPEQLLIWNPDLILVCHDNGSDGVSSYDFLMGDPRLCSLSAIREGRVYEVPYLPFNITDRPPSVPRILGMKWLANLFYPDHFDFDMEEEMKRFYSLFYGMDLSHEQIEQYLNPTQMEELLNGTDYS
jgi:iron complex transport system substrate-binding protein